MITITSKELREQFDRYRTIASKEPVAITQDGRESLVLMSAEDYRRLMNSDEVTEQRKSDIRHVMELHRKTIEKLAR